MKFVQIGVSSNPKDHVYTAVKDQDIELGLLVEPIPDFQESIKDVYKDIDNIVLEELAVVHDPSIQNVMLHWTEKHHGCGSVFKQHVNHHGYGEEDIIEVQCKAIGINELFDKHNIKELDHLFIDIEGYDYDVLKSLNISNYDIKAITYEHFHMGRDREVDLINHFWNNGYAIGKPSHYDRTVFKIPSNKLWSRIEANL